MGGGSLPVQSGNGAAVASLLVGTAAIVLPPAAVVAAPAAVYLGLRGRRAARGGARHGALAAAGIALGLIGLVALVGFALFGFGETVPGTGIE